MFQSFSPSTTSSFLLKIWQRRRSHLAWASLCGSSLASTRTYSVMLPLLQHWAPCKSEIQGLWKMGSMLSVHLNPELFTTLLSWPHLDPYLPLRSSGCQPHSPSSPWMNLSSSSLCHGLTLLLSRGPMACLLVLHSASFHVFHWQHVETSRSVYAK